MNPTPAQLYSLFFAAANLYSSGQTSCGLDVYYVAEDLERHMSPAPNEWERRNIDGQKKRLSDIVH